MSLKFQMNVSEAVRAEEWKKSHSIECPYLAARSSEPFKGIPALGERWAYTFVPTGLGMISKVKCILCGAEKCVTDTTDW